MSEHQNGLRAVPDPPAEDEAVARLIRLAGHRPPVPAEDAEIVKTAARAQWQWTVAAERRRARLYRGAGALLAAAAVLAAVVGSGLWQRLLKGFTDPVAVTAALDGEARRFWSGDVLETAAETAALRMTAADDSVRLDAGSRLRFVSASVVELERGAVYVDSTRPGSGLEVRTDLGTARHVGTQFAVRLEGEGDRRRMRVRVREGRVEVSDRSGRRRALRKGEGLAVTAGDLVAESVPCYGPPWEWATAARPPFSTRGRSILEVLEWGAREGCWELRFAYEADRRRLAAVEVGSATLPGGGLEDALDSVLIGSALGLRLDPEPLAEGVFRIERR